VRVGDGGQQSLVVGGARGRTSYRAVVSRRAGDAGEVHRRGDSGDDDVVLIERTPLTGGVHGRFPDRSDQVGQNAVIERRTRQRLSDDALRVRDVALRAGVTEPTLYHFFVNKESLIEAAQVERFNRGQIEVVAAFCDVASRCQSADEFFGVVLAIAEWVYQPARAAVRRRRFSAAGAAGERPALLLAVAASARESREILAKELHVAQRLGWVRHDVDAAALAAWLISQINSRFVIEISEDDETAAGWNRVSLEAILRVLGGPALDDVRPADLSSHPFFRG
jgi:AcrR family transcriptional regulator